MMHVISARNVNEALALGVQKVINEGAQRDSRNGPVRVFPGPVTTEYQKPDERVLFSPERDCNPFFHLMESLWMLAGRNDVEWISRFSSNIANYSDDGVTFHGAYGYRWRNHFEIQEKLPDGIRREVGTIDQIQTIMNLLRQNQDDRRIVLQMWDATVDLGRNGKDFPCNLMTLFRVNPYGRLDMTVYNRSNDMIWGAYGANAVHFSVLQEVMAAAIGVPLGSYYQVSTNFHAYEATLTPLLERGYQPNPGFDLYSLGNVSPFPIVNTPIDQWFQDLSMFMDEGPIIGLRDPFFKKVAVPIYLAWFEYKNKDNPQRFDKAMRLLDGVIAEDWRIACREWLERRM